VVQGRTPERLSIATLLWSLALLSHVFSCLAGVGKVALEASQRPAVAVLAWQFDSMPHTASIMHREGGQGLRVAGSDCFVQRGDLWVISPEGSDSERKQRYLMALPPVSIPNGSAWCLCYGLAQHKARKVHSKMQLMLNDWLFV
jgi:hypothetical protein